MGVRNWTEEEVNYLEEHWGITSIPRIAKVLNKSVNAIRCKAFKLGLKRFIHQGEYITLHQLVIALGLEGNYSYLNMRLTRDDFPIKYKKSVDMKYKIVYLEDFWKWAKINQNKIDFSNFEENMLGPEEQWVKTKRRLDKLQKKKFKNTPWTEAEDRRLKELVNAYKYSYKELSTMLKRTNGAIQRRLIDLGIKARPLKADNHIKWTEEEYTLLGELIKGGYNYNIMSEELNKSAKAIRGRVFDMYGTERLDKVKLLIGNGNWGDGSVGPVRRLKNVI